MVSNGYVMVDCTGINLLSDQAVTVPGIYAKCISAYNSGKPIIAVGCEYGLGVPMTPIPVMAIIEDGTCIFTSSILQVRVASNDSVTIVSLLQ